MWNTFSKPALILLLLIVATLLIYVGFELYVDYHASEKSSQDKLIESSLDTAEKFFVQINSDFEQNSIHLKEQISRKLQESTSRQAVHSELESYPFWGSFIYRNSELFTWEGFALTSPPFIEDIPDDSLYVGVHRQNNVTYLLGKVSFTIGEDDRFTLLTTRRLEQKNILPIAKDQEFDLARDPILKNKFPVYFNFYDPPPQPLDHYRTLQTTQSDSIGIVYALQEDMERYITATEARTKRWRTLFPVSLFILGSGLFLFWSYSHSSWTGLALQLPLLFLAWALLIRYGTPVQWIPQFFPETDEEQLASLSAISYYALHSIFTFFAAFSVITTLTRKWNRSHSEKHYQTFLYSFVLGAINVALILFFLITTYTTASAANIALLDLELIPNLASWILFISTGFFISSIAALLVAAWWFLFIIEKDKTVVIALIAVLSFFLFYFLADLAIGFSLFISWKFLLSFGLFGACIACAAYMYRFPDTFFQLSGFRFLLLIALLTSTAGYIIYANAHAERMDEQLFAAAREFTAEMDESARDATYELLTSIESRLRFLTTDDIMEQPSLVQARFQRAIQTSIKEEWHKYSYDIQLFDPGGIQISDYATNLDSPGTAFYNLLYIATSYSQERIRQETNRPVVQSRPASLAGDRYTTFYRGWIPVYDDLDPERIIAWVVAAVYIERPDFNKPIRAVLAASTEDDWKTSYYLAEFTDGNLSRSSVKGLYANQPKYNRLSEREMEIAQTDSIAYISNMTAQGPFRELIFKGTENKIVKASTPVPDFSSHMFSIFRFNVVILIAGLVLFYLFSLLGLKRFNLFGQSRKFQSRLLDGLVLVILLFLVVLITATQYAVNHQNESNLQREIVTKLDNLAGSIQAELEQQNTRDLQAVPLQEVTSPLDADAIFYRNQIVYESTTPQIFQQNLLPQMLPYPVHDFLYNRQRSHVVRTIDIGEETLLVGYRTILSEQNEPLGVVAIPTYLQSPLYTEQLLETTSYLLAIYLLIFGVFIIGTVFISSRMTKPLQYIQSGLNKISGGDLETTIPVKSRDEFGALSKAYNTMVGKLKVLQSELAKAEREAAWKEMAQQVAHEIKNPLTPMKLNLQHLKRQLKEMSGNPDQFRENVEHVTVNIIEQIESLNKIASDFSNFAHPTHEEFSEVEINELIRSVVEFYRPETPGQILHELNENSLYVMGAGDDLRRALINLIKNGYEAVEKDPCLVIRSSRSGNHAIIEIEDNGVGITENDREKIFAPKFSTKSSGTGLGLAITKKIIEAHEGSISFRSAAGKGTTFRIELPLISGENSADRVSPLPAKKPVVNRELVQGTRPERRGAK